MRRRSDFSKVAGVGAAFMTCCYLALGAGGYWKLGADFDLSKPITSVLPYDALAVACNAFLFVHCVVAYVVSPTSLRQAALGPAWAGLIAGGLCCHRWWQEWG
jgi:hypothetical protein